MKTVGMQRKMKLNKSTNKNYTNEKYTKQNNVYELKEN